MAALSDDQELKDKLELLRHSYEQVLDATKHQDDKVGRFLTAVSFLIGGSIALGTRTDLITTTYQLEAPPGHPTPLPAFLLSLFLLFIVISLVLLVTGLGARLHLPGEHEPIPKSHLFFLSISDLTERGLNEWKGMWSKDSKAVGESLRDEYQEEVVNIARRAKQKYNRTLYAGAFLQLAMLCLVLAAGLGFLAGAFPKVAGTAGTQPVDWSALAPRLTVAIAVTVFALALAIDFWWFERYARAQRWMRRAFVVLCPGYAAITVIHPGALHHVGNLLGYYDVAGPLQIAIGAMAIGSAWTVWKDWGPRTLIAIIGIVFVLGPGWFFSFGRLQLGLLVAAGMVVVLLLALRLFMEPFPQPSPGGSGKASRPAASRARRRNQQSKGEEARS